MTSMAAESVSTILVSCKQTRFHIETPNYREVRFFFFVVRHRRLTIPSSTLKAST